MISALAITYNEEENIESFIKSLSFADEIIIVDSGSTDKTLELARQYEVKIVNRSFDNFSAQKNFALQQAKHDWIVFFDLDEVISKELAEEIKQKTLFASNTKAYKVKRNFHFMGKRIKYSGFQNDSVVRLFKKEACSYNTNLVHETLDVNGTTETLKCRSDHFTYKSFDLYNQKLTQYSKLQAKMLYQKNLRPSLYHFLVRPWFRFFHQYVIKLGILDGKEGFILAYLSAFSVFKRYLYLWTMYRKIE
ncbi:glycosyltransferase family 2 protein [Ichthyenterobacterium magnum]|uniref:Glycosyltransferase involved in cell wall biosynthesis n=1 Tax=Ichthyenterobacterium magnum TaxID=1230530 RepID=A0A420DH04_9FLAO|nr:glycosyltransferase family 2 protein [Ichthyenterobacterium magnum]RKE92362.1 glycosyltransferase involved in cell wall biosynthesis [Ichthyenterobacterium magnum]